MVGPIIYVRGGIHIYDTPGVPSNFPCKWAKPNIKSLGLFNLYYLKLKFSTKRDYMFKFCSFSCQTSLSLPVYKYMIIINN